MLNVTVESDQYHNTPDRTQDDERLKSVDYWNLNGGM